MMQEPSQMRVHRLIALATLGLVAQAFVTFLSPAAASGTSASAPAPASVSTMRWGGAASPNMVSAAKNLPTTPTAVAPLWEVKTGTHQYSIPTLDRGRLYLGTNDRAVTRPGYKPSQGGALTCLDAATGRLIWQLPSPRYMEGVKPPYHFDQWQCGTCSGPVVDGERVYAAGNRGEVLCLDRQGQANGNAGPFLDELKYMNLGTTATAAGLLPTDGDIVWKFGLIPELDVVIHDVCASTLLLDGEFLYVTTSNGIDDKHKKIPRPQGPALIVLDKKTGRLVAREGEEVCARMFHCNWSSPSAGEVGGKRLIFFGGGDGMLYAFEPPHAPAPGEGVQTLKKVWSVDGNPPDYRFRDGQKIPYTVNGHKTPGGPSEFIGTPVFYEGRVYAAIGQSNQYGPGQGCLVCVDAATGKKVWESREVGRTLSTPAISGGLLYLPDYAGRLHCFDAATGRRLWVHELEGTAFCASAYVADGKVYVGTENNILWVLKAGREKQLLSRARLRSGSITPVATDGVLYLPTQLTLAAYPGPKP
jgi:outer membrane protein assembly factor BamB